MTHRISAPARWSVFAVVGALGGCVPVGDEVALLVPGEVDVAWDARFDAIDDGRVALVPVDVMVYAATSGAPVAGAELRVAAMGAEVGLVDPDGVSWLGDPWDAEGLESDCARSPEGCVGFAPVWDAWRDRYAVLSDEPVPAMTLRTDANGMARTYVWVDGFEASGASSGMGSHPVAVVVSTGDVEDSFYLVAR